MGDPMDSRPPASARSTFSTSNVNGLKWIERELSRLDSSKVDKAHYKPALESLKEKFKDFQSEIEKLRKEFGEDIEDVRRDLGKDITGVQDVACSAKDAAGQHVCTSEERIDLVEKTVNFWGTWFLRGLVGMILLLITAGGGWVYSHVRLEETAKQSSKAVEELKVAVGQVRQEQQEQRQTLNRIETEATTAPTVDTSTVEDALREVLEDVLDKKNR